MRAGRLFFQRNNGLWQNSFVDKTIEIKAPASHVWHTLTWRDHTDNCLDGRVSGDGPVLHIESDWKMGSPVLWRGKDGKLIVEGNVDRPGAQSTLAVHRFRCSQRTARRSAENDGISFRLTNFDGVTTLQVCRAISQHERRREVPRPKPLKFGIASCRKSKNYRKLTRWPISLPAARAWPSIRCCRRSSARFWPRWREHGASHEGH